MRCMRARLLDLPTIAESERSRSAFLSGSGMMAVGIAIDGRQAVARRFTKP